MVSSNILANEILNYNPSGAYHSVRNTPHLIPLRVIPPSINPSHSRNKTHRFHRFDPLGGYLVSKNKQVSMTQPHSTVTPAPTPWLCNGGKSPMNSGHQDLSQGSKSTSSIPQMTELEHGVMDVEVTQPLKDNDDTYQGQTWQVSTLSRHLLVFCKWVW